MNHSTGKAIGAAYSLGDVIDSVWHAVATVGTGRSGARLIGVCNLYKCNFHIVKRHLTV